MNQIISFHRYNPDLGLLPLTNRYLLRQFYKALKLNQTITLANHVKMTVPWFSKCGTEVFVTKSNVDWGSEELLLKFLDKTKSFIDVGANIGYYSLLASSSSQVLAFEPDPKFAQVLEENLAQFSNAQVIQEALFSEPGVMRLSLHNVGEMNSLMQNNSQSKGIMVK
ncbi:MAG: FkbM family methyltransferase, partial [Microcystaceae cyanobacterium]